MIDRAAIAAARRPLATQPDFLRTTPLMRLSGQSLGVECGEVWLKLEHLQVGGSFKARGMLYRLLANPVPDSGVIIASGGNAGIAVAAAARALGVRCEVFVPEVSPEAKRARLRALGAEVVVTGAAYSEALEACVARQQATGALQAHAYDQPEVVAGAGTLALEIEEQGGRPPDSVLVSVGGGGLIGGVAAWFASRAHVVALEPERAPTLHAARAAGQPVDVDVGVWPPIHWARAASVRCAGRSASAMCTTRCCCPTKPSAPRSCGCGRNSSWRSNPLPPWAWPRCKPARTSPSRKRRWP